MAKVSICIPVYNNEQSVKRLLESIEIQTFKDYEVIVTDDSADDNIKKLVSDKKYIKYYKNTNRLGSTANWNEAIKKSSGEYIKIMHHDDWFTDELSLQTFIDMLDEHPEADMAFCGTMQVSDGTSFARHISEADASLIEKDYRNLFLGNTIGAPSAVIIRRCSGKSDHQNVQLKYDEKLTWLVDMEYYMRILQNNSQFIYTEKPIVSIGISSGQLTQQCKDNTEMNLFEYSYIYDKYHLSDERTYRNKLMRIYADAGKEYKDISSYGIRRTDYQMMHVNKLMSKMEWKLSRFLNEKFLACFILICFIISLIPIFMLSGINQATGDDLGYGRLTHHAWITTHSLWDVIKAAGETVHNYYGGWQGTWLSIFLFTFQPEVFSPKAYIIVPYLMIFVFAGATAVLLHYVLVKMWGYDKFTYLTITILLVAAGIQFVPSTKSAIFWYNGATHYVVPYAIAILGLYFYLRFINENIIRSYIGFCVCMGLLGGVSYQAALLAPIIVILTLPFFYKWVSKKRAWMCFLPLMLEGIGLIISMKAPGNKRRGGEAFGFSIGQAVLTIFKSFAQGTTQAVFYIKEHPILLVIFVISGFIIWRMLNTQKDKKKYPYPILFVILSYCTYCAMFAPQIYADVAVSGGVYNMNYYVFLIMVFVNIIYVEGWLSYRVMEKNSHQVKGMIPLLIFVVLFTIIFKSTLKESTTFLCIDYMQSGRAADFKEQMIEQKQILLNDNIKEAVVPEINDDQGPLMHMPITDKPEAWTNTITKEFYKKESVISIPRETWNTMYK